MQKAILLGCVIAAGAYSARPNPAGRLRRRTLLSATQGRRAAAMFLSTMADCQVASKQGTEGSCTQNPAITTGSGSGQ
jgi:hypothetical protein